MWILPSYYNPYWWKLSESEIQGLPLCDRCSNKEMEAILSTTLFVDSLNYNKHGTAILNTEKVRNHYVAVKIFLTVHALDVFFHLQVLSRFFNELLNKTLETFPSLKTENLVPYLSHSHAATAYDAVWALALAWNEAIPVLLHDTNVCSLETEEGVQNSIKEVLNNSLKAISFHGVSVRLKLYL